MVLRNRSAAVASSRFRIGRRPFPGPDPPLFDLFQMPRGNLSTPRQEQHALAIVKMLIQHVAHAQVPGRRIAEHPPEHTPELAVQVGLLDHLAGRPDASALRVVHIERQRPPGRQLVVADPDSHGLTIRFPGFPDRWAPRDNTRDAWRPPAG
jgi:hypothetical protein